MRHWIAQAIECTVILAIMAQIIAFGFSWMIPWIILAGLAFAALGFACARIHVGITPRIRAAFSNDGAPTRFRIAVLLPFTIAVIGMAIFLDAAMAYCFDPWWQPTRGWLVATAARIRSATIRPS